MKATVSLGQQARARQLPASPTPPKKRPGPKVNLTWREDFCRYYQEHGGLYRAAEYAGVNSTTVYDEMHRNPAFQQAAHEAHQRFLDGREQNLAALANNGNVVGDIVLLKAHRPDKFVEKNLSISASFSTQLDPAAGQALLATMLGHLAPQPAPPALEPPTQP